MGLNQFLQDVGCELQEILWKDITGEPMSRHFECLERDLDRATKELKQLRLCVDQLSRALDEKERRAAWLQARVQVYMYVADRANAWRYALELDRLRNTLTQERARLERRRQAYQRQLTRIRHLQDQLDDSPFASYSNG